MVDGDYRSRVEKLDGLIKRTLTEKKSKIPGLGVGVVYKGNMIYSQGFGYADVEKKTKINGDTVFRLASISKLFTTIAIMQFWEKGKFKLEDPVTKYLPENYRRLIKKKKSWEDITFRHLFTHRSGIGELPRKSAVLKAPGFGLNIKWPKPIPPLKNLMKGKVIPSSPPDLKYAYCNFAFAILGFLIEVFSGQTYRDYILENILDPLEMTHSDFIRSERVKDNESTGYMLGLFNKKMKVATYWQGIMKSAGNLYSSLNDMGKFATMLMNKGTYKEQQILKPETLELCWTPQYIAHPSLKDTYAMGLTFHLHHLMGTRIMQHTGLLNGHTSGFVIIPDEKLAIMTFSNLGEFYHGDQTQRIKNLLVQQMLDYEEKEINQREPSEYDIEVIQNIEGIYGSYPGVLTNTRILMSGGEYYVKYTDNALILRGLYGPYKKGKELYPTEDPYVYRYDTKDGAFIQEYNKVAFQLSKSGEVTHLCWNLVQLPKKSLLQSLRLKIPGICALVILMLILLIELL